MGYNTKYFKLGEKLIVDNEISLLRYLLKNDRI